MPYITDIAYKNWYNKLESLSENTNINVHLPDELNF